MILTFDVEDFINPISIKSLEKILFLLDKYSLNGIFFITGHMAERLSSFPSIIDMLEKHEVGYHSSSHSVRPIIPEFTDVNSFFEAVEISMKRETSHIDPLSGEIEGVGGVNAVRELFPNKKVIAFRAPGFCWTPPHLEALKRLGIEYDFSSGIYGSKISTDEVYEFKGLKFFPYPFRIMGRIILSLDRCYYYLSKLLLKAIKRRITCLYGHEWELVLKTSWDNIYKKSNPRDLYRAEMVEENRILKNLFYFEIILRTIRKLVDMKLIDITTEIEKIDFKTIKTKDIDILTTYLKSMDWCRNTLNYNPKHLFNHFSKYFK